jgi:hypothetical protein
MSSQYNNVFDTGIENHVVIIIKQLLEIYNNVISKKEIV